MRNLILILAVLMLAATLSAGEKKLMHCFFFTVIDTATAADWDAFGKATDALPGKIMGLSKIWHGKLMRPMSYPDAKGGKVVRQHGVCMEFADEAALKAYGPDPAHKEWEAVYAKVRVPGTTTVNFMGQ
jgi:hypothetical protein